MLLWIIGLRDREAGVLTVEWLAAGVSRICWNNRSISCPYLFHHKGQPIGDFRKAFDTAASAAGITELLPHDLRRSAIRNLVRAGVKETVAMRLSGHRTRSVFDRYNIVSEDDLIDASKKLEAFLAEAVKESKIEKLKE